MTYGKGICRVAIELTRGEELLRKYPLTLGALIKVKQIAGCNATVEAGLRRFFLLKLLPCVTVYLPSVYMKG